MKLLLLLLAMLSTVAYAEPDPVALLRLADEVRFPRESFEVNAHAVTVGSVPDDRVYGVISKGNEKSIIFTKEPASDYGQIVLMSGRDLWVFMPEVSQAIRLSMAQRLTGQVANGDLARANFSGDYSPTILGKETIGGQDYWKLNLQAVDKSVTYNQVMLWIGVKDNHPFKAEFFAMSGRLLKTCEYLDFKMVLGRMRPTKLILRNAMNPGDATELVYTAMKLRNTPDKMFTKDYLNKLQGGL